MKTWVIRFRRKDKEIFDLVRNGTKDIETRAATLRHRKVMVGNELRFVCGDEEITRKVVRVIHYLSLERLFKDEELTRIMPWVKSQEEARNVYFSFSGYKEKIEKFGVIAWELSS